MADSTKEYVLPDSERVKDFPRPGPDWFSVLFGFEEVRDHKEMQRLLFLDEDKLVSRVNGKAYKIGKFSCPSLKELREEVLGNEEMVKKTKGKLTMQFKEGEVSTLQAAKANKYSLFQAASQFNCLEFVGPSVVPEDGVQGYVFDRTQGPACSIGAGPATVFRNYFVPLNGEIGQTRNNMIDNLKDVSEFLGNKPNGRFYKMKGGYTLAENKGLKELNNILESSEEIREGMKERVRIGVHEDVQVTSSNWGKKLHPDPSHEITQIFGSACAVAYSNNTRGLWAPFASLVLQASYEATLLAAVKNMYNHEGKEGSKKVFLTKLGGGVFGNSMEWIQVAIEGACEKMKDFGLEVIVVSRPGW